MKKKNLIAITFVIITVLGILSVVVVKYLPDLLKKPDKETNVVNSTNENDTNNIAFYTEQSRQLLLVADKTNFEIGDEGQVLFTVTMPAYIDESSIVIQDSQGNQLLSVETIQFSDDGNVKSFSGSVSVETSTPQVITCQAKIGNHISNELNLYITPHITFQDIEECGVVLSDLIENIKDKSGTERLKAAIDFLKADNRVKIVFAESESIVQFITNSGVAGFYDNSDFDDTLGSGEYFSQDDPTTKAFAVFNERGTTKNSNGSITLLDGGNTWTNNNVLILRPVYDFWNDNKMNMNTSVHIRNGEKLAKALENGNCDDKTGVDVMNAIVNGELSNYGTVILNTHGGKQEEMVPTELI